MNKLDILTTVSLVANVFLTVVSVALAVVAWKDNQKKNSQVKVWMEQSNGVSQALIRIIQDKWAGLYSGVDDITNSVHAVQASAFSLYQSLYEERILSEKEVKEQQRKLRKKIDKDMGLDDRDENKQLNNSASSQESKKSIRGRK